MNNFKQIGLILIYLFSINYCLSEIEDKNETQILFVYEHCRHGNRAPNDKKNGLYNNITKKDIYDIYWEKPGILTESGKLQHFFLGLRNKYLYKNLLNFCEYNQNEIILRSTGVKRSTESLYYQLLGMYYQDNSDIDNSIIQFDEELYKYSMPPNINNWNNKKFAQLNDKIKQFLKNKKIKGVDLASFNSETKKKFNIKKIKKDFIFVTQRCKNHDKYIKEQKNKYKTIIKSNFIDKYQMKLKNFLNISNDSYFYKRGISKSLADQFISDYLNGRKELIHFKEKTGINLEEYFEKCKNIYFFYMYNIYCFSKSCILNSSKFMKDIIKYFDNAINYIKGKRKNKNKEVKMVIDLGHDVTVNSIHIFMNIAFNANYTYCNFACNIYFELHQIKQSNNFIVKYYDNDSLMLTIDYNEFRSQIMKMIWNDNEIDDFCNGKKENIFKIHKEQDLISNYKIDNHEITNMNMDRFDKNSDL